MAENTVMLMAALAVGDLTKTLPDIIREAAKSELGILALLIVAVGLLAYVFFRQASERIKVGVFALIFAGAAGYGIAVVKTAQAPRNGPAPVEPVAAQKAALVIAGTVVDAVSRNAILQAQVSIDGSPAAATTDDTGTSASRCRRTRWRNRDGCGW